MSITFQTNNKKGLCNLLIASAGPFINILMAICFTLCKNIPYANLIIYSNWIIAIFNLIPIYPLDGGRIIKAILEMKCKNMDVLKNVNKIANVTVILLTILTSIGIIYFKNIAILIAIIFLWTMVIIENRKYKTKIRVNKIIESDRRQRRIKL